MYSMLKRVMQFYTCYSLLHIYEYNILEILKIKDLKTTIRDCKTANKQDMRCHSTDNKAQDII